MASERDEKGLTMTRRQFLLASATGVAGLVVGYLAGRATAPVREVTTTVTETETQIETVTETTTETVTQAVEKPVEKRYERVKVANINELAVGKPITRTYMGKQIVIIKLGEPAEGGVGPDRDIVAFSSFCTHMGGGLFYDAQNKALVCPIHYSVFDPARGGMVVVGHATEYLPQVILEYDENTGDIYAVGFTRLVYGVESNL